MPLPPPQTQSLIPPPWFCFLEIFISIEMQNMEHLLACLGQKTMMLLLPTEQCSHSVAYPDSCLSKNVYPKYIRNRGATAEMQIKSSGIRVPEDYSCPHTHTKTLAASFTSPPLLLKPLVVQLSVVIIRSQEVKAVVKHVV